MDKTDEQLIEDYLAGDKNTFDSLVRRNLNAIYAYLVRFIGDENDAEDVLQEVFVKVWKNLRRYRKGESFKVWIFAIARNAAIDRMRKRKEFVFSSFNNDEGGNSITDTLSDMAPLPEELLMRKDSSEVLEKALLLLKPNYREVLLLHYHEELTFSEIGKIVGRPLNTVKSQYRRALTVLREILLSLGFDNAPK